MIAVGEPLLEFSAVEEGPLRDVRHYEIGVGGDTSNLVIAVQRLGGSAGYITRLGDDEFGQIIWDLWQREGVDTQHVVFEPGGSTGIYFISRCKDKHNFTYYRENSAASHLQVEDIPASYIAKARVFHVSGISQAISESALQAVEWGIQKAREAGVVVSYDPNIRLGLWDLARARDVVHQTLPMVDYIFPSLEDGEALTGSREPEQIVHYLLDRGPSLVILKLGRDGAVIGTQSGMTLIPGFKVNTVDSTGAGDTFVGAFLVALLEGSSLTHATRFANAAAALKTTGLGAVSAIPYREQVDELLQQTEEAKSGGDELV
ncbi:MAG: sugar kinase [Aggregatilineales bacterium]